jgi:metaxin
MQMATTTAQHSLLSVPPSLAKLFSFFPLKTYSPLRPAKVPIVNPLLWIHPPALSPLGKESVLSADVECLKWQAHIALRGLRNISVRWDVSQDGAINGRLPNLQTPSERTKDPGGELIAAQDIPTWMDEKVGALDDLEGYKDIDSRDESHAWIALLEGDVHAALVSLVFSNVHPSQLNRIPQAMAQPLPSFFYHTILQLPPSTAQRPVETILTPPPAPLSGFSSPLPPYGARLSPNAINARYRDAIAALSECLGHHEWFLGSPYVRLI